MKYLAKTFYDAFILMFLLNIGLVIQESLNPNGVSISDSAILLWVIIFFVLSVIKNSPEKKE